MSTITGGVSMKKVITTGLYCLCFILLQDCLVFSADNNINWLISHWGTLNADNYPRFSKINQIFHRVAMVADKPIGIKPTLKGIKTIGDPWASCCPDGTIVLTQKAIDYCYDNASEAIGDSRMAFIIGHELAHLAGNDFWHLNVLESVYQYGKDAALFQAILSLLRKTEDTDNTAHAREIRKKKELKADKYGFLYMSLAGYDPGAIVGSTENDFFDHWANRITSQVAYSDLSHPESKQRSDFLRSQMNRMIDQLNFFHIGVRYYQLGQYANALDYLEIFNKDFPSREVSNNLGLIHYQLAMGCLAECLGDGAFRFQLATFLDTHTRAETFKNQAVRSSHISLKDCPQLLVFKDEIESAQQYFKEAVAKDPLYDPPHLNLSSAYLMASIVSRQCHFKESVLLHSAIAELEKIDSPESINNLAIAKYLRGNLADEPDMFDWSIRKLEHIKKEYPGAAYNLARMMDERGKSENANIAWEQYIQMKSTGVYYQIARKSLKKNEDKQSYYSGLFTETIPVKPGLLDARTHKMIKNFHQHSFQVSNIAYTFYSDQTLRLLVSGDKIQFVESIVHKDLCLNDIHNNYGRPCRIFDTQFGTTIVYEKFALDLIDEKVRMVIYF
jgi:Zn-dependent protease with chaperone function